MTLVLVAVGFVLMEPVTYATHRWVMHSPVGMRLHRSHHTGRHDRLEANDAFPLLFVTIGIVLAVSGLWQVAIGTLLYGIAYALVHDVYAHRRLGAVRRVPVVERLAAAHAVHHQTSGEPYGMLLPLRSSTRNRANSSSRNQPSARARRTTSAWGPS